jgi:hypothetical protein
VPVVGHQCHQLRGEFGIHGQVPLIDSRAKPTQDGARGTAILVGVVDHVEGGEVEHHPATDGELPDDHCCRGWDRGWLLEHVEHGHDDLDAVEDMRKRGRINDS